MENKETVSIDFDRIATAIHFLYTNFKKQPSLEDVAKEINLSPFHFQRMFTEWAGVSPKKFLQYLSVQYAKEKLNEPDQNLFTTTIETGLSSSGRLHDLFVKMEAMTPGEYKKGDLHIDYQTCTSDFGPVLIASTTKGICHVAFYNDENNALNELKTLFPLAQLTDQSNVHLENIKAFFKNQNLDLAEIKLHLKGTDFQVKVWSALLKIPSGELSTYGKIADEIKSPNASRAVGTAIGSNPIAYLIPCHRVIRSTGIIGEYRWGSERKMAMIGMEGVREELKPNSENQSN